MFLRLAVLHIFVCYVKRASVFRIKYFPKRADFFLQIFSENLTREACYKIITEKPVPKHCGCNEISIFGNQTTTNCSFLCGSKSKCCNVKCVFKTILVDGTVNGNALASCYERLDGLNVTAAINQCESLGEMRNARTFWIHKTIISLTVKQAPSDQQYCDMPRDSFNIIYCFNWKLFVECKSLEKISDCSASKKSAEQCFKVLETNGTESAVTEAKTQTNGVTTQATIAETETDAVDQKTGDSSQAPKSQS